MAFWLWIVVALAALVVLYAAFTYNRLIAIGKRGDAAWSDIDVQLKRRYDLIPALVETVKGYARHESSTLEAVVEARSQAAAASNGPISARGAGERGLAGAVGRIFALAEAYPDLKASQNFIDLQKNLSEIENNVQYARRYYNAVVRDQNTLVESFPSMLVASTAGFLPRDYFQLESEAERAAPQIHLG